MNKVFAVQIGTDVPFSPAQHFPTIASLVSVLTNNAIAFAAVISLIIIIIAGFGIIAGAGSGDSKKMEQGKQTLTMAILGLIIVVFALWIIQIIGLVLGINVLNPFTKQVLN